MYFRLGEDKTSDAFCFVKSRLSYKPLSCVTAAREEGPVHWGRLDEPAGSYCKRINTKGELHQLLLSCLFWSLQNYCTFSRSLKAFCPPPYFLSATWSGQTLQSGTQTCYQHLRSVSLHLHTLQNCTHTPDAPTWQCGVAFFPGSVSWSVQEYRLWNGYVVNGDSFYLSLVLMVLL